MGRAKIYIFLARKICQKQYAVTPIMAVQETIRNIKPRAFIELQPLFFSRRT